MQLGYPGSDSRSSDSVKVNRISAGDIPFGAAVALNPDNSVIAFGDGHTDVNFLGIAVRTVKQQTDVFEPAGGYKNGDPTDVMVRGSVIVAFKGKGTPTAGGSVYIRVTADPLLPIAAIGDIEAEADGTNTVQLENLRFTTGRTDASGTVEVSVLSRRI